MYVCVCMCACVHAAAHTHIHRHYRAHSRYANIEGGQVMEEMSQLASGIAIAKLEQDEMEGVDEDEWGDDDEEDD